MLNALTAQLVIANSAKSGLSKQKLLQFCTFWMLWSFGYICTSYYRVLFYMQPSTSDINDWDHTITRFKLQAANYMCFSTTWLSPSDQKSALVTSYCQYLRAIFAKCGVSWSLASRNLENVHRVDKNHRTAEFKCTAGLWISASCRNI